MNLISSIKHILLKYMLSWLVLSYKPFRQTNLVRFLNKEQVRDYIRVNLPSFVRSKKVAFFDIGCNIGVASEIFLEVFSPSEHFIVDPNLVVLERARSKFPDAKSVHAAIGGKAGRVDLFLDPKSDGESPHNASSTVLSHLDWVCVEVEQVTLSSLLGDYLDYLVVLKIDIEGAEIQALTELLDAGLELKNVSLFLEEHRGLIADPVYDRELSVLVKRLEKRGVHVAFWV